MSGYIGTQPVPQATQKRQAFTATAGQTTFATSGYSVGFVDVYMNGVKLAAADYTATNGSDVVLASAALVNDIIEIVAFTSFVTSGGLAAVNNLSDVASASTALTNLGVTSTAAELNTLDAVPRGSIIYGNSSAATARLSKGATGTVLTAGADDISWVAASGGGEQTFTATGSITAGQPVGINPNGTISTAAANQSDALSGGSSNTSAKPRMDYDTNANKIVICTQGPPSGYSSYVEIADPAAGLTATFGTPVVSRSSSTDNATPAFDPATGRTNILFVAARNNTQQLFAVSGIVSGTSMTFGSEATGTYNNNGDITNPGFVNAGSNKSVAVARQDTTNAGLGSSGYQGTVYVLTTSGTSISFGNPVLLDAGVETNNRHGIVYDSNADKVVIFYKDGNTTSYARVGTISGTSISLGTRVAFSSTTFQMANTQVYPCFDSNSNKVVLATINSVTNKPSVIVGTVSGTSISFGTPVVLNESDAGDMHATFDSATNTVNISYYASSGDPGYWLQKVKVNGTSVDIGPKISLTGNSITGPVRYADDIDRTIVLNSSSGGTIAITNPSAPTYVGLAKENISDGATGKVTVVGGINESQSSLLTGFPYGLAPTSSTIAVGPSNKIGTALSATKIYLSEGSI